MNTEKKVWTVSELREELLLNGKYEGNDPFNWDKVDVGNPAHLVFLYGRPERGCTQDVFDLFPNFYTEELARYNELASNEFYKPYFVLLKSIKSAEAKREFCEKLYTYHDIKKHAQMYYCQLNQLRSNWRFGVLNTLPKVESDELKTIFDSLKKYSDENQVHLSNGNSVNIKVDAHFKPEEFKEILKNPFITEMTFVKSEGIDMTAVLAAAKVNKELTEVNLKAGNFTMQDSEISEFCSLRVGKKHWGTFDLRGLNEVQNKKINGKDDVSEIEKPKTELTKTTPTTKTADYNRSNFIAKFAKPVIGCAVLAGVCYLAFHGSFMMAAALLITSAYIALKRNQIVKSLASSLNQDVGATSELHKVA